MTAEPYAETSETPTARGARREPLQEGGEGGGPLMVVKVGGANLTRPDYVRDLSRHLRARVQRGERIVVVHGGGPEIGALHDALDVPFTRVDGLRVTSEEGMRLATMVLCGLVNKRVVARLVSDGLPAMGLSGVDLGLLRSELLDPERLGRVGSAPAVDVTRLRVLLDAGLLPVIAPVSLGPDGEPVNVNADTAAHAIATALSATSLDFVSDIPGVRTRKGSTRVAARLTVRDIQRLVSEGDVIRGGMIPKLESAVAAVAAGVGRVRVGNLGGLGRNTATEVVA